MKSFASGLLFGMVFQFAVGPVCISVLQAGLCQSFKEAFAMVWGVTLADAGYILLALLGVSSIMRLELVRVAMGMGGVVLLTYFGIRNLLSSRSGFRISASAERGLGGSFRYGFLLTLSNPLTVLFWAGVFGGLIASGRFSSGLAAYSFGLGCVASTAIFMTGVAWLGQYIGGFVKNSAVLVWLDRAVGLFLIGFAVKLALDVFAHKQGG